MKKNIITKKTLYKELKINLRIIIGLIFFLVSLFYLVVIFIKQLERDFIFSNCGELIIAMIVFVVFGCLIGLRQILNVFKLIKYLNSDDFVIEIDKVIEKITLSKKYRVVLEYNIAFFSVLNEWKKIKEGATYYVFNLPNNETLIKSTLNYDLSNDLSQKVIDYHINKKIILEDWE